MIAMLFLTNCRMENISTYCPNIQFYTIEEQRELNRIRTEVKTKNVADGLILDKFLIDYFNLREDLKLCYE